MRAFLLAVAAAAAVSAQPITFFSAIVSQGRVTQQETLLLSHTNAPGSTHGALTHWWITGGASTDNAIITVYADGQAPMAFNPGMACGTGFSDDTDVPWAIELMGKQAAMGAWHSNFKIPFQKSINVTYKAGPGQPDDTIYMIARGAENLPLSIGGVPLPTTAQMNLQVVQRTVQPLEYVNVIDQPSGNGMVFMHTLAFQAANLNTLEGCYRAMSPYTQDYPGILLSSGTEDYFVSAYYFNAGKFRGPTSGLTHASFPQGGPVQLSAYRFHVSDPLVFQDGFKLVWRNGDTTDPSTGLKCTLQTGGKTVGSPSAANVTSYAWFYSW